MSATWRTFAPSHSTCNDLALLAVAEAGVAVANAVPTVRAHADVVTERSNGEGVGELLTGPLVTGERPLRPSVGGW